MASTESDHGKEFKGDWHRKILPNTPHGGKECSEASFEYISKYSWGEKQNEEPDDRRNYYGQADKALAEEDCGGQKDEAHRLEDLVKNVDGGEDYNVEFGVKRLVCSENTIPQPTPEPAGVYFTCHVVDLC